MARIGNVGFDHKVFLKKKKTKLRRKARGGRGGEGEKARGKATGALNEQGVQNQPKEVKRRDGGVPWTRKPFWEIHGRN